MLKPTVKVHSENGVLVAEFWDCLRLDAGAVQELRTKYEAHLRAGGRPEVVIDLVGVGFAGSAALGHFVALHRVARSKTGRLVFCNVDLTVLDVFRVSKLEPLFRFVPDRAAALAEVANPTPGGPHGSLPVPNLGARPSSAEPGVGGTPTAPPPRQSNGQGLVRSSRRRNLS